jgi:hypothetical protein
MFDRLSVLARATVIAKLVLHTLFLVQMFLFPGVEVRLAWDVVHLALVAVYTFARVSGDDGGAQGMDVLDWAFIAWGFLGHVGDAVGRGVIKWVVVPRLFERYLASFDGGAFCEEGKGGRTGEERHMRWWHRARLKLGWGWGRGRGRGGAYGYGEAGNHHDPGLGGDRNGEGRQGARPEQHLLGDMEGQI